MLLRVDQLSISLHIDGSPETVVRDVNLCIEPGQAIALVGESGSGKSLISLAIARLLPRAARVCGGSIWLGDTELTSLSDAEFRRHRGRSIAMVFQEPMNALNPVLTIGRQLLESIQLHTALRGTAAGREAESLLTSVGIDEPPLRLRQFPHELSGGMRQRVLIAMALSGKPKLLLADEPTTALDATIQREILLLLHRLQAERGLSILFVTHDLGLARGFARDVSVIYAGRIIESGNTGAVFSNPGHPYTRQLLACAPRLDDGRYAARDSQSGRLHVISGEPPRAPFRISGCAFHPRCDDMSDDPQCRAETPLNTLYSDDRRAACWHCSLMPAALSSNSC